MNFSVDVYLPAFDMFAVPITVNPVVSQPGNASYSARGIFDTDDIDVVAMDGSIFSDHRTELYLRESEFTVVPMQNDRVVIPFDCNGKALGEFEIIDTCTNGGGQTKATLRKWMAASP